MSQVLNAQDNLSDSESVVSELGAESKGKFEMDNKVDFFTDIFGIKADDHWKQQKKDQQASQTDKAKRANLLNEIFD